MREIRTGCNNNCPYYYKNTGCVLPESEGFYCPSELVTYKLRYDNDAELHSGVIVKEDNISYLARRCAICENYIEITSGEIICSECKEAIKKLKEWLKEEHHD